MHDYQRNLRSGVHNPSFALSSTFLQTNAFYPSTFIALPCIKKLVSWLVFWRALPGIVS